jgi:hypothetical protein
MPTILLSGVHFGLSFYPPHCLLEVDPAVDIITIDLTPIVFLAPLAELFEMVLHTFSEGNFGTDVVIHYNGQVDK